MVAASGVAVLSPTPTPFNTASVAKVPVMEEQKDCKIMRRTKYRHFCIFLPARCPIAGRRGSLSSHCQDSLEEEMLPAKCTKTNY